VDTGGYIVRMRVLEIEGKISNIDEWFRSHKFKYAMIWKSVNTDSENIDMVHLPEEGTIESIVTKVRNIFRDFHDG
jgi:hypothetical protein